MSRTSKIVWGVGLVAAASAGLLGVRADGPVPYAVGCQDVGLFCMRYDWGPPGVDLGVLLWLSFWISPLAVVFTVRLLFGEPRRRPKST